MRITNVRGRALEIVATGQLVNPDETVEVPDEIGKSLCQQPANWVAAKTPKTPKTPKNTTPEEGDE